MVIEEPLAGGMYEDGRVVRVGDTVRRPVRSSSAAAQALLVHLDRVGFDGAPRYLGMDASGREILSYLPGEVPLPPYPDWAMTDRALVGLGGLLRRFHDASTSFDASRIEGWSTEWADPAGGRFACHNDLFPENVVFRGGLPVALIDFGEASPGRPLWDVAIAAEIWAPLSAAAARIGSQRGLDAVARVGLLARAYGLQRDRAPELLEIVDEMRAVSQAHIRDEVAHGNTVLAAYWAERGGEAQAAADDAWLRRNRGRLLRAIDPG